MMNDDDFGVTREYMLELQASTCTGVTSETSPCAQDINVHGRIELWISFSQAKPPISHIRPYRRTGVGSYARTLG
jgi:hypothetical protein